jgi:hypothetical protein
VNLYLRVQTLMAMQSGHKDVFWFEHEQPYVQWILLRFMLPCTGVLIVGVTSFREREQVPSLLGGGGGFEWILAIVAWFSPFDSVLLLSIALAPAPLL